MLIILYKTNLRKHGLLVLILGLIPYFAIPAIYIFMNNPELFQGERIHVYFWVNPYTQLGWYNISYLLFFVYVTVLLFLSFRISWKKAIFIGVSAYTAQNLMYNSETVLRLIFFAGNSDSWQWYLFSTLFDLLLYVIFYLACGRNYRKERTVNFNSVLLLIFFMASIVIINIYSQWLFILNYQGDYDYVNLGIATYSGFCALLLLAVQFGFFQQSKSAMEKSVMEKVLETAKGQQQLSEENVDIINRKVHDLKHQVRILKGSMGENEQRKALEEIEQSLAIYDSDIKTGNDVLDTIIMEKSLQCKANHIDFSLMVDAKKLDFISKSDIFVLFGNMLDNSIEASLKESEENRIIVLSIRECSGYLRIELENYCSGMVEFKDKLPLSTKKNDGNHGFGSKSILYITKKYQGTMDVRLVDHKYTVILLIPIGKKL